MRITLHPSSTRGSLLSRNPISKRQRTSLSNHPSPIALSGELCNNEYGVSRKPFFPGRNGFPSKQCGKSIVTPNARSSDDSGNEFCGIYNGDPDACSVAVLSIVFRGKRLQLRSCDVIIVSPACRPRQDVSSKKSILPSVTVTLQASDADEYVKAASRLLQSVE